MYELILQNGTSIQIAKNDFSDLCDWSSAKLKCEEIGEGWRLPTISELEEIFENKESFNFANYGFWSYWSGDNFNSEKANAFSGVEGNKIQEFKNENFYVRAVKTIHYKNLNIIPTNPELVLIALNPTKEAIKNKSVFSRDETFWNLLINAGIIQNEVKEIDLKNRAQQVFENQKFTNVRIGFADLLPLIDETNSNKVKIPVATASNFLINTTNIRNSSKIALLGQKVVNAFARDFKLKKWEELEKKVSSGIKM